MPDSVVRRITWRTADLARALGLAMLFLFLWTFFWKVYTALFIALIAVLLAILIHAPARFLSRWIPFRIGFALSVLAFLAAIAALVLKLIPQILDQVALLAGQLPLALESVTAWVEEKTGTVGHGEMAQRINEQIGEFIGRFVPIAFNLITTFFGSFAIVVLAIFLAAQPEMYRGLLLRAVAQPGRERAARIYDEAGRNLRNWVIGKVFTMVVIGVFTWIGLTLFDIPGALALATLAALLEFIPTFGPTIAAAPAVITAFSISPLTALYVAIFYFGLQQVQNAVTVPLVERRAVAIPPAMLLIWQLMLAVGFGILGLFVATPLLAVIVVMVRILYLEPQEDLYEWDRREGHSGEPGEGVVPSPGSAG